MTYHTLRLMRRRMGEPGPVAWRRRRDRARRLVLLVDVSGSMSFGSVDWRKSDIAAELTSVFAFAAVENQDRAGLMLFSDRVHSYIQPRRGRPHAQVIVRAAVDAALRGGSGHADLEQASRFLERVSAKRAVVILISDFLDVSFERPLRRLNRKHDVIGLVITDPREERFPGSALVQLVDAESGEAKTIDLGNSDIGRRAVHRRLQLERRFRSTAVDWMTVSTAMPYDRDLLRFFRSRLAVTR